MKKKPLPFRVLLSIPVALLPGEAALAEKAATSVSASVVDALAAGTVVASPKSIASPARSTPAAVPTRAGEVTPVPTNDRAAMRFEVGGQPGMTYAVTVPASNAVEIVSDSGERMQVVVSTAPSTDAAGNQSVSVVARVQGAPPRDGAYSGSFVVYVNYN